MIGKCGDGKYKKKRVEGRERVGGRGEEAEDERGVGGQEEGT